MVPSDIAQGRGKASRVSGNAVHGLTFLAAWNYEVSFSIEKGWGRP
jgi:hypothetical protein